MCLFFYEIESLLTSVPDFIGLVCCLLWKSGRLQPSFSELKRWKDLENVVFCALVQNCVNDVWVRKDKNAKIFHIVEQNLVIAVIGNWWNTTVSCLKIPLMWRNKANTCLIVNYLWAPCWGFRPLQSTVTAGLCTFLIESHGLLSYSLTSLLFLTDWNGSHIKSLSRTLVFSSCEVIPCSLWKVKNASKSLLINMYHMYW